MERKLRLKVATVFGKAMAKELPEFAPVKIKSMYIWPGEAVWKRDTHDSSYFVVLSPEPKGQRDEMTVELAWSRRKRFPELMQRPWLTTPEDIAQAHELAEGTVRLGKLSPNLFDWIPIEEGTVDDVVSFFMSSLRKHGIPFLERL